MNIRCLSSNSLLILGNTLPLELIGISLSHGVDHFFCQAIVGSVNATFYTIMSEFWRFLSELASLFVTNRIICFHVWFGSLYLILTIVISQVCINHLQFLTNPFGRSMEGLSIVPNRSRICSIQTVLFGKDIVLLLKSNPILRISQSGDANPTTIFASY